MRKIVPLLLLLPILSVCTHFKNMDLPDCTGVLSEEEQTELQIWHKKHGNLFDARIHSGKT